MMESNDYENAIFPTRCTLCKRLFQLENGMKPKLLPCLHTFCEDCIRLQCKDERFTCPLDSQECRNVQGVMDQFFMLEKLNKDKMTMESTRDNPCEGCASEDSGNEQLKPSATGYCKQCSDWLCDSCIAAHRKVRLTKEHEILSHDEYKMSMANEVGKWHFCPEHPSQMLCLFCDACQSLTCRSCHSEKAKHQQHPCQFLNLKASNEKSVVAKLVEEVNEKQEGVKKQHLELFRHKANVRIVQNTVSDQIESCFREICEKLDQRKKELLQFVVTQCSDAEKKIEMQNERLTKVEKIMKFAVSFSQKAIAFDQPFPLMKTRVALLSQLRNLTKIPLQSLTVDQVDIKFSSDNSNIDTLIKQVGQIKDSKQVDVKQQPSDSPKKAPNPAPSVPSLKIKSESAKESQCAGGDSGVSSASSELQPSSRGRGRPPGIRGATRGRPRGAGGIAGVQNMATSIARVVAHRPTRGKGIVRRKQVPAVLQKQLKGKRPPELMSISGPGPCATEMTARNPGILPQVIKQQQPVPAVLTSPKLTSPSKKVISPMKTHHVLARAPEPEQATVIRQDMSSALVPVASIPAPMPPMKFQSPPRFPGSPIHQTQFSRSPPQAPPRMMGNEHYQQWKNVFPPRVRPEMGMLPEPEHISTSGIHPAPMHDQVVYEKRYQEYAMRTNMMQAQPSLHGHEQMIIRTATEYVRPAFHRTSPIAGQAMVSPTIVGLPQPQMWQPRAIEGPPSMAAIPYEQDPRSSRQSMVPFMESPQITMEGEFMPSGVFAPMKSPALPSVSSLSRVSSETVSPVKRPKIAEKCPRMQPPSQVKNEQQKFSPCAIVELDTPPRSVASSNKGFPQQLAVSQTERGNNDETFVTEPKMQVPEIIDLEEATSIVRNMPLDSWSRDSSMSQNGQKSSPLPANPLRSATLPSFVSSSNSRGEEEEQTQAQALACELMRSVDSAQNILSQDKWESPPTNADNSMVNKNISNTDQKPKLSAPLNPCESTEIEIKSVSSICSSASSVGRKKKSKKSRTFQQPMFSESEDSATSEPELGPSIRETAVEASEHANEKKKNRKKKKGEVGNVRKRRMGGKDEIEHEEWCAVCQDGGDLILCDTCPKIYHLECHVPILDKPPSGDFSCTLCREMPRVIRHRGRPPDKQLMNNDIKRLCEKLLLTMYSLPDGEDFHKPVPDEFEEYYEEITDPIDFGKIRTKLNNSPNVSGTRGYAKVSQFLDDLKRVFNNARSFNGPESELGQIALKFQKALKFHAGRILGSDADGRTSDARKSPRIVNGCLEDAYSESDKFQSTSESSES